MTSHLYKELTRAELETVVSSALGDALAEAELLTGGMFNTTYLVRTKNNGDAVLRAGPVNRHLLLPFEHHLMRAEQQVYTLCARHGIPASEILAVDTSKTVIDRDFMLVRYIPSRPMSQVELTPDRQASVDAALGQTVAKLHGIHAGGFGRIARPADMPLFERWSDCLLQELADWESVMLPGTYYTVRQHEQFRRLFQQAAPVLDRITTPCLVHADLWKGNVLLGAQADGAPVLAAVIDADRAVWGDPEMDFALNGWIGQTPELWRGYGKTPSESREARLRRAVYRLLYALLDSYVYLCEYAQPENAAVRKADAEEQAALLETMLAQ